MKLPLLVSVPHAGLAIPTEIHSMTKLAMKDIVEDGDGGAAEIYDFKDKVAEYVTTDIARAFVDLNRAPDDFRADGVVKTHTCFNVPIYANPLGDELTKDLLDKYYYPYHRKLKELSKNVKLGVDCHTMLAVGPPIGPMAGQERPLVCLSNADKTCPDEWLRAMADCFVEAFDVEVAINHPFKGGYIIKSHADELPWIQVELSRRDFISNKEKRQKVVLALSKWCDLIG